jgi:hypothetical protein
VARKGNSLSFTARRSSFTEVGPEEHPDAALSRDVRPAASLNRLLKPQRRVTFLPMKLTWAIVVYLLMGLIIGWGIFMAVHGSYWLLITSLVAYVLAFARIGCIHH